MSGPDLEGGPPPGHTQQNLRYTSRNTKGSLKLSGILDRYPGLRWEGLSCADLGCNVGGFTRELLRRGAGKVAAVDTGYGTLDWDLRSDKRVVVMERRNALHLQGELKGLDLVVSDLAWTRQSLVVPVVFGYLNPEGCFFSLLKPQYEQSGGGRRRPLLEEEAALDLASRVRDSLDVPEGHRLEFHSSEVRGASGTLEFWLCFLPKNRDHAALQ